MPRTAFKAGGASTAPGRFDSFAAPPTFRPVDRLATRLASSLTLPSVARVLLGRRLTTRLIPWPVPASSRGRRCGGSSTRQGSILHTNLGRAPLVPRGARGGRARSWADTPTSRWTLAAGERPGSPPGRHRTRCCASWTGAEAALGRQQLRRGGAARAAATRAGGGRERDRLPRRAGGDRRRLPVPDVIGQGGARWWRWAPPTARGSEDYRRGSAEQGEALVLKVRRSNFYLGG